MAEDIASGGEAAKPPEGAPPNVNAAGELPAVESPALSPAADAPDTVPDPTFAVVPPARDEGAQAASAFRIRPRHRRQAVLAASVAIAAGIGMLAGSLLTAAPPAPRRDGLQRQQALQESIDRLGNEVTALKASLAASRRAEKSEIAKISDRLRPAPEITGSIPKPAAVPLPQPRPSAPDAGRILSDWTIHDVYDGSVYVKGHGEVYQAARGAPLPGLGPITAIERRHGGWVVVTPKGMIVSQHERRHFEAN